MDKLRIRAAAGGMLMMAAMAIGAVSVQSSAAPPSSVSAGNFTIRSDSIEPPVDAQFFPDGPGADLLNGNCASCHSASMVLTQPVLSADQWKAIVIKMRDVYHAPVAEQDVPAIVGHLQALPTQKGAAGRP